MKIYFVETSLNAIEREFVANGVKNGLVSYWYEKKPEKYEAFRKKNPAFTLMVDSGAFSARSKRAVISVEEYTKFCNEINDYADYFIALDEIESWQKSQKNFQYMLNHLNDITKIIPVYHTTEPYEVLDGYCTSSDYVAIGIYRELKIRKRQFFNYIRNILDRIPPKKKIHLLGVNSPPLLFRFADKITSCDSTSASKVQGDQNRSFTFSGLPTMTNGFPRNRISFEDRMFLRKFNLMRNLQLEKEINGYVETLKHG